jgi:predicted DNA-binding transcriptional regulator YafY
MQNPADVAVLKLWGERMQINRLFEMVYLLMGKKGMTAKELAEHFEVSARTVLRDVDTLSTAGIPIYASQGRGGGISLPDNFVLNKAVVSEDEQNQILFALQSMSATGNINTDDILGKLRSFFQRRDTQWIEVDFSRWGNSVTDKAKFASLKNAVINKQAVSFSYSDSYGKTVDRSVYPLRLVFKSKSWYLQAFCLLKSDYRTFKISRMRNVAMLTDTFNEAAFQAPEMDPPNHQSPSLVDVKLLFAPQAAYRVYDEFDEQRIIKNGDGSFAVSVKLPNDDRLYGYVLSFGILIDVLEPQSVRDEIIRQAEAIKRKYALKT